jgi:hypothetical protein
MLKIPQKQLNEVIVKINTHIENRKIEKPIKQTPQRIFDTANGFYEAALRCMKSELNSDGSAMSPMIPSIVNFAFACELYIKSRLMHIDKDTHGHELEKLFNELDDDFKISLSLEYRKALEVDQASFESDIKTFSNAFTSWRYVYEGKSENSIILHKLIILACALYRVQKKLNPEWEVQNDMDVRLYTPDYDILFFVIDSIGSFRIGFNPN